MIDRVGCGDPLRVLLKQAVRIEDSRAALYALFPNCENKNKLDLSRKKSNYEEILDKTQQY